MDYYERAGLTPYLDKLGFDLVGYGCTTCIGNSGPLPEEVSAAVAEDGLAVVAVLSGNRNFEGRINPDVRMNYLASPPLVVAYALAGTMDFDIDHRAARGPDATATPVYLRDIWPTPRRGGGGSSTRHRRPTCSRSSYAEVFAGDERWRSLPTPDGRHASPGTRVDVRAQAARTSTACPRSPAPVTDIAGRAGARPAGRLGHHRPHLARPATIARTAPAGEVPDRARRAARTSTPTARAGATTR